MENKDKQQMNIVIVGHVDHGKSTVIGRLLADTNSLPDGKLEQVKATCERNSKPFEYAFLLDALKDEQDQGITIDSARVFFKTKQRDYIIIDAPGHIEFLKNMITGASRAESALLVIDASEGVRENSRRHGYMLAMLGIRQIVVLVNKMDLVDYSEETFDAIETEYRAFLSEIKVEPKAFIPVSGMQGDNIASLSERIPWYKGQTVLETLDDFKKEEDRLDKPFRMPVQGIYKFTKYGDSRRVVAGTIDTGVLNVGDEVVFYPSGKKTHIKSFEAFNAPKRDKMGAGYATAFTMTEEIYINRGEVAVRSDQRPTRTSTRIRVSLFWLGKKPMVKKKEYFLKIGTAKVPVRIAEIVQVIDASNLNNQGIKEEIGRHAVAEVILELKRPIAFDVASELSYTSRFVIVDDYEIWGGGIIRESLSDAHSDMRKNVILRNYKWSRGEITPKQRAERYNQKSTLLLITGEKDVGKKRLAKELEKELHQEGKFVYFLGIGNLLYGVDSDIKERKNQREEHIRRLAEVANILLDAGLILLVTAVELNQMDLEVVKTVVNADNIETVWVGDEVSTDIAVDYHLASNDSIEESVNILKEMLQDKGIIFRPW